MWHGRQIVENEYQLEPTDGENAAQIFGTSGANVGAHYAAWRRRQRMAPSSEETKVEPIYQSYSADQNHAERPSEDRNYGQDLDYATIGFARGVAAEEPETTYDTTFQEFRRPVHNTSTVATNYVQQASTESVATKNSVFKCMVLQGILLIGAVITIVIFGFLAFSKAGNYQTNDTPVQTTSAVTTASTNKHIEKTTPLKDRCQVLYRGICFWSEIHDSEDIDLTYAKQICRTEDANMANIYSEAHYILIMNHLRHTIPAGRYETAVWIGLRYNNWSGKLTLNDGFTAAPYVYWYQTGGYVDVGLHVPNNFSPHRQGMMTAFHGRKMFGVVCEVGDSDQAFV